MKQDKLSSSTKHFIQDIYMIKRICKKHFVRRILVSLMLAVLISGVFILPVFKFCLDRNEIIILPKNLKNEASNAYEVWISRILVDSKELDLNLIANDVWVLNDGKLFCTDNDISLTVFVKRYNNFTISFFSHSWCGMVDIISRDQVHSEDLYSTGVNEKEVSIPNIIKINVAKFALVYGVSIILLFALIFILYPLITKCIHLKNIVISLSIILIYSLLLLFISVKNRDAFSSAIYLLTGLMCISVFIGYFAFTGFNSWAHQLITSKRRQLRIAAFMLSILFYIVSFKWDNQFLPINSSAELYVYLICRLLTLAVLIIVGQLVVDVFRRIAKGDCWFSLFIKSLIVCFSMFLVLFALVTPGVWLWDEFFLLEYAKGLRLVFWQNYLSSVFYIISLMILPTPIMIVVLQNLLISSFTAYVISKVLITYKIKLRWLIIIPFVLLPNLFFLFYTIRVVLYSYILLFLLFYLWVNKEKNFGYFQLIIVSALVAVVVTLRSEGIVFIFTVPIIVYVSFAKRVGRKKYLTFVLSSLAFSLILLAPQQMQTSNEKNAYSLVPMLYSLGHMLNRDLDANSLEEATDGIDAIIDHNMVRDKAIWEELPVFWENQWEIIGRATDENYSGFVHSFIKIVINNPIEFIKVKLNNTSIIMGTSADYSSKAGFSTLRIENENDAAEYFIFSNRLAKPINTELRIRVLSLLNATINDNRQVNRVVKILLNGFPSLIAIVGGLFFAGIRRKQELFWICFSLSAYAGVLFVSAPGVYFMYYLPIYLTGTTILVISVLEVAKYTKSSRECPPNIERC